MKTNLQRRDFLSKFCMTGFACCAFMPGSQLLASESTISMNGKIDPKAMEYCGYKCPADCPLKKGTVENNVELKKKAYEIFKIKEKFGVEFDADKIFCWGCKPVDKPLGITVKGCTVRNCAIGKGIDCCVQCNELTQCKKELWENFPDFKKAVIKMQDEYKG